MISKGQGNHSNNNSNLVFIISLIITILVVLFALIANDTFRKTVDSSFIFVTNNFNWLYLLSAMFFFLFCLFIAFSKYGKIKLGKEDAVVEYKTITWLAMLFSAGVGIGSVFWGVAEPVSNYVTFKNQGMSDSIAANYSMVQSFIHWGLFPWSFYAVVGISMAYFQHKKDKPGLISTLFIPLIGEKRANGPIGKIIDIFAVFTAIIGIASSLGQGVLQLNAGLREVFGISSNVFYQIVLLVPITIIYLFAAASGADKAIAKISRMNVMVVMFLLCICFIIGPSLMQINIFVNTVGSLDLFANALKIDPFNSSANHYLNNTTVFYLAWWVSWAPFVGSFIASISKGRTIREFVFCVIFIPSLVAFLWFSVFGGLGLNLKNVYPDLLEKIFSSPESGLFIALSQYPFGKILSILSLLLLVGLLVTTSNSGLFSLAQFSSNGIANPTLFRKLFWGLLQSGLAIALLVSGGLEPLKYFTIIGSFPLIILLVIVCIAFYKELITKIK